MRRPPLILMLAAGCAMTPFASTEAAAQAVLTPGDPLMPPEGYGLVWDDEFSEAAAPNARNWDYETQRNQDGWYNGELQYYSRSRPENARIEHGRLIIEARAEDLSRAQLPDWGGQRFSSARLTTRDRASWHYGYFEIRAKLPCVVGAWPAIWLLPEHQDMRWQGGEIDIVEAVGYEPSIVHHAIQTAERNFALGNQLQAESQLDYCASFHDYQLLWTPRQVVIGVDGNVAFAASGKQFDRKMVLILNVAVGGEWAGMHGIDRGVFPARMEVESVRVWQMKADQ